MKRISPCLWFDHQGEEAARFYTSIFKNSKIIATSRYGEAAAKASGQKKGSVMTVQFQLEGADFLALNGGPMFQFSPAISFFVHCEFSQEIDSHWKQLREGGTVLMELDRYPFSDKYGWVQDRYGVSWQLILANRAQKITPSFLFVREQYGKAEEAIQFYVSLLQNSKIERIERYAAGEGDREGAVKYAVFSLNGQDFIAMESGGDHPFTFTPAISLMIYCENQQQIDELWEKLSARGQKEQCGWLKDRYGVSWQIVPEFLARIMKEGDAVKSERVMAALMSMTKPDLAKLKQAAEG